MEAGGEETGAARIRAEPDGGHGGRERWGGALELEGEARKVAGDEAKAMECSGEARVALYRQRGEVPSCRRHGRVCACMGSEAGEEGGT